MGFLRDAEDESPDEQVDPHDPDEPDMDDSDDPEQVPCPYCGKSIGDQAEYCHHCRSFISSEDAPVRRRWPWWVILGAVLAIAAVAGWYLT